MIENSVESGFSKYVLYYKGHKIRKAYYGKYLVYNWAQAVSIQGATSLNTGDYSKYVMVINNRVIDNNEATISCDNPNVDIDNVQHYVYFNKSLESPYTLTLTYKDYSATIDVFVYDISVEIQ